MKYSVYILYSEKDGRLYTGCTRDIGKRLQLHNSGKVPSTKERRPLRLIHEEEFENKGDAFNRERFLKSLWGGKVKKKILKNYLDGLNPAQRGRPTSIQKIEV